MSQKPGFINRFKNWMLSPFESQDMSEMGASLQTLVSQAGMNRRKNIRIDYSDFGAVGPLPSCSFQGQKCEIANISVGGICIKENAKIKQLNPGQEMTLQLVWPDTEIQLTARIVASSFNKKHLQFTSVPLEAHLRISMASKACAAGQKMNLVPHPIGSGLVLTAIELWNGVSGENIIFRDDPHAFAEMTLGGHTYEFYHGSLPLMKQGQGQKPVPALFLFDIIICLSNIKNPSPRIQNLLADLFSQAYHLPAAGEN